MKRIIKFIKEDFVNVRAYLSYRKGKNVPMALFVPYYVIIGMLAVLTIPIWLTITCIHYKVTLKQLKEYFKMKESL